VTKSDYFMGLSAESQARYEAKITLLHRRVDGNS
jgi:hypothetical protein